MRMWQKIRCSRVANLVAAQVLRSVIPFPALPSAFSLLPVLDDYIEDLKLSSGAQWPAVDIEGYPERSFNYFESIKDQ